MMTKDGLLLISNEMFPLQNFLQITNSQKNRMELTSDELREIYQGDGNTTYRNFITGLIHEAMNKQLI